MWRELQSIPVSRFPLEGGKDSKRDTHDQDVEVGHQQVGQKPLHDLLLRHPVEPVVLPPLLLLLLAVLAQPLHLDVEIVPLRYDELPVTVTIIIVILE